MQAIETYIYSLDPIYLGILILSCTLSSSLIFITICRLFIKTNSQQDTDFKVETYSDAFGVAFAILLGLIIVNSWSSYDNTEILVKKEVNYLDDMYRFSKYLSPENGKEMQETLKKYVNFVIEDEWPSLVKGGQPLVGQGYLFKIFDILYTSKINTKNEELFTLEMSKAGKKLIETRRLRNYSAESSMTPFMWIILICCNFITFFVLALGSLGSLKLHVIMQTLYAMGIGLMILLVVVLDRPFYYGAFYDGGISVKLYENLRDSWAQGKYL